MWGHEGTANGTLFCPGWDTILRRWDTILHRWDTKWDTILHRWDIKWDTILPKWDTKGHQRTPFWCPTSLLLTYGAEEGSLRGFWRPSG